MPGLDPPKKYEAIFKKELRRTKTTRVVQYILSLLIYYLDIIDINIDPQEGNSSSRPAITVLGQYYNSRLGFIPRSFEQQPQQTAPQLSIQDLAYIINNFIYTVQQQNQNYSTRIDRLAKQIQDIKLLNANILVLPLGQPKGINIPKPTSKIRAPSYKLKALFMFNPNIDNSRYRSKNYKDQIIQLKTQILEIDSNLSQIGKIKIIRTSQFLGGLVGTQQRSNIDRIRQIEEQAVPYTSIIQEFNRFLNKLEGMYKDNNLQEQRERQFQTLSQIGLVRDFLTQLNSLTNLINLRLDDQVLTRRFFIGLRL